MLISLPILGMLVACNTKDEPRSESVATTAAPVASATPEPATPPDPAKVEPAATAPAKPRADDLTGVGGRSKVPTIAEWDAVGEITVRHSGPLGCETKMVREWLRVSCRTGAGAHQIKSVSVLSSNGMSKGEVFTFSKSGVSSVVLPVRDGYSAKVRFAWSDWGSRTLSMDFAHGAPKPVIEFDASAPK